MKKRLIMMTILVLGLFVLSGCGQKTPTENAICEGNNCKIGSNKSDTPIKEFTMTSFTEVIDGKYYPQYSSKEITVKKGDLVRIKLTVTSGMHDFKIDEFNVYEDTKELNKEYVIEFVADKAGEFVYYCTKPKHRENGHWGTLKVIE